MSYGANTALSSHATNHKAAAAIEWQALSIKNIEGASQSVRVAWLVQELRGLVAVVDVISVVRGLAHVDAARFFSEQKENWQRSQSVGRERIAFTKVAGSGAAFDSNRPAQDLEVCTLPDLSRVLDALAAVQGQPAGAEDVSSRLQRSVQDWARIRLEQRVRELSDDQANIKAALQSVFPASEPNTTTQSTFAASSASADASACNGTAVTPSRAAAAAAELSTPSTVSAPPAPASNNAVPSTSSSRHGSPYIGPASGVSAPPSGTFWLYDPVIPAKGAPASGGGTSAPGSNGSPRVVGQANSHGSPLLSGQPIGVNQLNSLNGLNGLNGAGALPLISTPASLVSALTSGTGSVGSTGSTGQMVQSRKRPRESAVAALPAQALNLNRVTGGAELFRCPLCGIELANRDDGSTVASDVAVASCGHLYCTGCLAGAMLSGLPDEVFRCKRRRCGALPVWYDRVRHGVATQRVEVFKGQPSEQWLLPEKHRRFLAPDAQGASGQHRRGVVLTVSTRGVPEDSRTPSAASSGPWPAPSPSSSPAITRGPSPTLPPISTITGAPSVQQRWPLSPGSSASASPGIGLPALVGTNAGAGGGAGMSLPRHESCTLYAGQMPDEAANRMLRKLCGYFWFSLY